MSDLLDSVLSDISPEQRQRMAQQLGVDNETLERGITLAVPVMIGGMQETANSQERRASFQSALSAQPAASLDDLLGQAMQNMGGGAPTAASRGTTRPSSSDDMLGQIFGQKQDKVEQGLGKASGMSSSAMGQLMKILGPLIMSAIFKQQGQRKSNSDDVGGMLTEERNKIEQKHPQAKSILGMLLDQDGDGDFDISDIFKLGLNWFMKKR
jgi:hypothetical protein